MPKTIIFDFDGTIADTLSACIHIANKNAKSWGFQEVDEKDLERLKGMTPFELLGEFKIPFYKVPFLIKKFQLELYESMENVRLFPGIRTLLDELQKKGFILGIITSNTEDNVHRFLKKNNIDHFDFIHGEKNIFGKSGTILNVIKSRGIVKKDSLYIGDEVRDIEAAKKSGIRCISVSWGFNTEILLKKHTQTVVSTPRELFETIIKQTQ